MVKEILKNRWFIGAIITLVTVIFATIISVIPIFEVMELRSINSRFDLRGPIAQDTSIVIVAVDDMAFASLQQKWPYPRGVFARLVTNLAKAGARLIIFDIEFTESDVYDDEDLKLARVANDIKKVVFAGKIVAEVGRHGIDNTHVLKPIPQLLRSDAPWGIVNIPEDIDGFVRKYLIYQNAGPVNYFSIGMTSIIELLDADPNEVKFKNGDVYIGNYMIKLYDLNTVLINYRGPTGAFRTYSISAVLDDSDFDLIPGEDTNIFDTHLAWGTFHNKIVLIGASVEELQDNKLTPFFGNDPKKRKMPGVEVHANALSTMLRGDYLQSVNAWLQLVMLIFFTAITTFITCNFKPLKGFFFNILEIGFIIFIAMLLFSEYNLIIVVIRPIIAVILAYVINGVYSILNEQHEKRYYKDTFKHYVAESVVEKMLSSGERPKFGGERKELSILFSDIRGFTSFSEHFEPEEIANHLKNYLSRMVEVIQRNEGIVDKFIGDAIMALFGTPYTYADHAEKACRTAVEMVKQLREIQKRYSAANQKYFQIGIGINTGLVTVGNFGSEHLFDYTAIGDDVNLASRLESANKHYQTTIIISEQTYTQVKEKAYVRELDIIRVVGRIKPVRIYELLAIDTIQQIERDFIIDAFTDGLNAYHDCRWYDALREFRRVLRYFPSDGPSKVYTRRCLDFIENPPPVDWDHIYNAKSK